jgi:epoxyqueuosine reductase
MVILMHSCMKRQVKVVYILYNMRGKVIDMKSDFEKIAIEHGDRLKVISIEHLKELREIIENFKEQEELNDFQKWIVTGLYQFETPEEAFKVNSIILIAIHHPFYAKVDFIKEGKKNTFLSLVRSDFNKTEEYVRKFVEENKYSIKASSNLPLKRLGAHSGLAKYGRNNITYVDGLGSNFSYAAYFSDMLCEEDTWGEVKNAEICNKCNLCMENCPTGAIRKDRFLIDNQRCLSCINEAPGEFPAWIPVTAHHTLYDCLICQRICPMNHAQIDKIIDCISFTEEETNMLLDGKPIDTFSKEFKTKIYTLGIDEWYASIPRNLKTLFEM